MVTTQGGSDHRGAKKVGAQTFVAVIWDFVERAELEDSLKFLRSDLDFVPNTAFGNETFRLRPKIEKRLPSKTE